MYQGKFSSNNQNQKAANSDLLAERSRTLKTAQALPKGQPSRQLPPQAGRAQAAPSSRAQAPQARPQMPPQGRARTAQQQPMQYPANQNQQYAMQPQRRGPSIGGVIFYTFYFMMILLFVGGTFLGLNWLNGWLVKYEAAQPTVKCQQVFDELFANPDWGKLYTLSGMQDTLYEGQEQFVTYMTEKTQGKTLSFVETSAGTSGGKKYFVKLGDERIGFFTLEGEAEKKTDVPEWEFGKLELTFPRNESYRISKMDGTTAYVNGQPLDDSFTIQMTTTSAEKFLPVGTAVPRKCVQLITDLAVQPTVTVKDQSGKEIPVTYDEATRTYTAETEAGGTIPDAEKNVVINALKARAEYMIRASGSTAKVEKYYDSSSQAYKDIINMGSELWMNKDNGHQFIVEEVTDYVRYSDDLFYARGKVVMKVTLKDNGTRDDTVDMAMLFRRKNGNFVCYEMTNEDVSKTVNEVRLTFKQDGTVLNSFFVSENATEIDTPVMTVPEGKKFIGWVNEAVNDLGQHDLVFEPDENGKVNLSVGTSLEPMTLLPYFEKVES